MDSGGSPDLVDRYCAAFKPDCLVIDQLRNMHANAKVGTRAQNLDLVAAATRRLLTKHNCVGISVGQANAGDHGKQKLFLEMDDFDESRTGVPASADLMVALGVDSAMEANRQRAVNLPKNKLTGRHDHFQVKVDTDRSIMQ